MESENSLAALFYGVTKFGMSLFMEAKNSASQTNGGNMEDKTKSETGETDALTIRYNAHIQAREQESPALVDIELDAKVIRLGLMNHLPEEGAKPKPRLRVVGGREINKSRGKEPV